MKGLVGLGPLPGLTDHDARLFPQALCPQPGRPIAQIGQRLTPQRREGAVPPREAAARIQRRLQHLSQRGREDPRRRACHFCGERRQHFLQLGDRGALQKQFPALGHAGQDRGPPHLEDCRQRPIVRVRRGLGGLADQWIRATARLAHQEPGCQRDMLGYRLPVQPRQQHLRGPACHLVTAEGRGRQRRRDKPALDLIVEARHRDVAGDAHPPPLKRPHGPDRHVVAGCHEGIEPGLSFVQQHLDRRRPAVFLEITLND